MLRLTELRLPLDHPPQALEDAVRERLALAPDELESVSVFRRGHDARRRSAIKLVYTVDCVVKNEAAVLARFQAAHPTNPHVTIAPDMSWRQPVAVEQGAELAGKAGYKRPIVIGAGPCGFMAALMLARMGLRPLLLERGKVVRERTVDTFALWRRGELTPESNVQFGEGGAGTFSDGKLYSQVRDPRFLGRRVLEEFVKPEPRRKFSIWRTRILARFGWFPWSSIFAQRLRPPEGSIALAPVWTDWFWRMEHAG